MVKCWKFIDQFKVKVVFEVLCGDKMIQEIVVWYQVYLNQVSIWKCQVVEGMVDVFVWGGKFEGLSEVEVKELYVKIGRLVVENDFLLEGFK